MNDTALPLITLGISCYNAQESIARAIESALAQTWKNKEIVVVDDHSSDKSLEIVEDLKNRYPGQIRYFRNKKNGGIAMVRNEIVRRSQGSYIAFFDDDDVSDPDRVLLQYRALAKIGTEKPGICYTARNQIFPDGSCHYVPTFATGEMICGEKVALKILTGRPFSRERGGGATCSCMASKETLEQMGGFDNSMRKGEDTDLVIRLSLRSGCFVGLARPLVEQTITLTGDKGAAIEREHWIMLMKKHRAFLEEKGQYEFCLRWINVKFDFIAGYRMTFIKNFSCLFFLHPIRVFLRVWWSLPNLRANLLNRHWRSSL